MVIVNTKVKEIIKNEGFQTSSNYFEVLERKVIALIKDSCARAKANNRVTAQDRDL